MAEGNRPDDAPAAEELTLWVDEFIRRLDERAAVDLERFLERAPAPLRDELRERCREVVFLRGVMRGSGNEG